MQTITEAELSATLPAVLDSLDDGDVVNIERDGEVVGSLSAVRNTIHRSDREPQGLAFVEKLRLLREDLRAQGMEGVSVEEIIAWKNEGRM